MKAPLVILKITTLVLLPLAIFRSFHPPLPLSLFPPLLLLLPGSPAAAPPSTPRCSP